MQKFDKLKGLDTLLHQLNPLHTFDQLGRSHTLDQLDKLGTIRKRSQIHSRRDPRYPKMEAPRSQDETEKAGAAKIMFFIA